MPDEDYEAGVEPDPDQEEEAVEVGVLEIALSCAGLRVLRDLGYYLHDAGSSD